MKATSIDIGSATRPSQLVRDYLAGKKELEKLVTGFPSLATIQAVLDAREAFPIDRGTLVQVLESQNTVSNTSGLSSENTRSLLDPSTFTVTTGHQLCLFTGPFYFISKIASVVATCRKLSGEFPGRRFVPVFWLASEDHDFAEVSQIRLFGRTLLWETRQKGPVGTFSLEEMQPLLQELSDVLPAGQDHHQLLDLLQKAYAHTNLSEAMRFLVNALFGAYGIVILEANDPRLKRLFMNEVRAEWTAHQAERHVGKTNDWLESKGYKQQVQPRPINLFVFRNGLRQRLEARNENLFGLAGTGEELSREQIEGWTSEHPEYFSPNVILRPLYQEKILPNVAYVGGPGEVAYWLQLKALFTSHGIPFPAVLLRDSTLLLDKASQHRMEKLNLDDVDLFRDRSLMEAKILGEHAVPDLEVEKDQLKAVFEKLIAKAREADPTLENAARAEEARQLSSIDQLGKRMLKAAKSREVVKIQQLEALLGFVFPEGELQERKLNYFELSLRMGPDLISELVDRFDPFAGRLQILSA